MTTVGIWRRPEPEENNNNILPTPLNDFILWIKYKIKVFVSRVMVRMPVLSLGYVFGLKSLAITA
jgi:hypothetical protein